MRAAHIGALLLWVACALVFEARLARARRRGPDAAWAERRRLHAVVALEHAALAAALLLGWVAMRCHGWSVGQPRWLGVKLLVVGSLIVPLEAMHAYFTHVWIARGLGQATDGSLPRDLERGIGMVEMVRALEALLLGFGLPLIVWLSVRRPF